MHRAFGATLLIGGLVGACAAAFVVFAGDGEHGTVWIVALALPMLLICLATTWRGDTVPLAIRLAAIALGCGAIVAATVAHVWA